MTYDDVVGWLVWGSSKIGALRIELFLLLPPADLEHSSQILMLWAGNGLTQTHCSGHVVLRCCLSYGEQHAIEMCFRGVLKPQNVKILLAAFVFI